MDSSNRKNIDQDWKNQVEKEKEESKAENQSYHQPTFVIFISSLGMQAMIALGLLENPLTNKKEKNLEQARYLIDTLDIIKAKTLNNLEENETKMLEESLYSLRMAYLNETKTIKES